MSERTRNATKAVLDAWKQSEATAYAKGFAAGLEAGAEILEAMEPATQGMTSTLICEALERIATHLRERAREEKAKL